VAATVVRDSVGAASWTRATRPAAAELRGVVRRGHVGFVQQAAASQRWVEPPPPAVTLIVTLDGWLRADGSELPVAWVGALTSRHALVECGPAYGGLDLKLEPLGAYRVLGVPMAALEGGTVALDDLLGADGRRLAEALGDAPGWDARFDVLDRFLARRLRTGPRVAGEVAWAWARLRATDGLVPIAELARETGWSRRHLGARFREQVGLPPKTVARLLRFERVRRLVAAQPARWADIAYECGYADQSHLNRDFRDLAGTTPTRFVASMLPPGYASAYGS
jgi:AraC-like DNA-binding protein